MNTEIKTVWQPVPPWPTKTKLLETKLPIPDRKKVIDYKPKKVLGHLRSNEMRKWIVEEIKPETKPRLDARFDWDAEYESIVDFYAALAQKKGWLEYIRQAVRDKQQESPLFRNLGKDVARRIGENSCD